MNAFYKLHPLTKGAFFLCAFVLTLSVNHPVLSALSLCFALLYIGVSSGRAFFASLRFCVPVVALVGLFNMLFAHYGMTPLFTVGNTDFTLEALCYGLNQGMVMAAVMLWFRALSYVQDSAETAYLLRFAPKLALLFSMVLGFLPRFHAKLGDIRDAQAGLRGGAKQDMKSRLKTALQNLSGLVTYALESSIVTADLMEARGFRQRAVSYARYRMTLRDVAYLILIFLCFAYILYAVIAGRMKFLFEPVIAYRSNDILTIIFFTVLMSLPSAVELWEVLLWKKSNAKI